MTRAEAEFQVRREIVEQMTEEALQEIETRWEWDRWWRCRQSEFRTRVQAQMQRRRELQGVG
jgi:hypothetical protein